MLKNIKIVLFSLLILSSFAFFSCKDKDEIVFNKFDVEAIDLEYKWAVVKDPYVACRENPSYESKVSKNLRKGMMEKIIGEKTVKIIDKSENEETVKYEKWIAFEEGWVPESTVDIYLNKLRARNSINN